jgi:predicted nucleic acid-binding protein
VLSQWVIREHHSDNARRLAGSSMFAAGLMLAECANALWRKSRVGDLAPQDCERRLGLIRMVPVVYVPDEELVEATLAIAQAIDHPIYDCLYLALSLRQAAPLVTDDARLGSKWTRSLGLPPPVALADLAI